jgi:phospholipid/cholesterol/gamma-HCH transport system substrate-binding protein
MNRSRDFLVGVLFFGLLFVLGVFTIFLADLRFGSARILTASFERVDGLEVGAGVRINGLRSGTVGAIRRDAAAGRILVDLRFEDDPELREGAKFEIRDLSFLGGKVVSITNGPLSAAALDLTKVREGKPQVDVFARLNRLADNLDGLITDNRANVTRAVADLADSAAEVKKFLATNRENLTAAVSRVASFSAALDRDGARILGDVAEVTGRLRRGEGTLGMLLTDDGLGKRLTATAEKISAVADRLNRGEGTIGRLLTDDTLARSLEAAVADLRAFTAEVREGKGTLGLLVRDRKLYDEATATVASLKSAADRLDTALGSDAQNNVVGLLLRDPKLAEDLKRSVKALSDYLESQRENAPITTFAGLLFKPF